MIQGEFLTGPFWKFLDTGPLQIASTKMTGHHSEVLHCSYNGAIGPKMKFGCKFWPEGPIDLRPTRLNQRSARILDPGNSRRESASFFLVDHEKWFSEVSIWFRNMRVTKWNLVLVSKYENGHLIISISSRQVRTRKIILNLVSKKLHFLFRVRVRF